MQPVFTMQYAEFRVADYLGKKLKNTSVFIPASAQEKGIDLLLYRHHQGRSTCSTVQVKMSRTYYGSANRTAYPYYLWFNRFPVQVNADWYILVGIYARHAVDARHASVKDIAWDQIMLAFTQQEMAQFMSQVKQKKDPSKDDRMFGFGFGDDQQIFQTRGWPEPRDMSAYLIENRLHEINESLR